MSACVHYCNVCGKTRYGGDWMHKNCGPCPHDGPMTASTPRDVLDPEDAVDKALLFVFQLSGKDYRKMQTAMSAIAFIRALEQDGYTVAALARHEPLDVERLLDALHEYERGGWLDAPDGDRERFRAEWVAAEYARLEAADKT